MFAIAARAPIAVFLTCSAFISFAATLLPGAAFAVCAAPEGIAPEEVVTARQGAIAWKPVEGATSYRVRILSRVPNGKIVASHDTVVTLPRFVPPQPLAEDKAKVVVRLNAVCGSEASAEAVHAFVIDTTAQCVLEGLSVSQNAGKAELKWAPLKDAQTYEVRSFALDGALIGSQEVRAAAVQLYLNVPSAVVSVRPLCSAGPGEAVYRTVVTD